MFIEISYDNNSYLINVNKITRVSCTENYLYVWSGKDHKVSLPIRLYAEIKSKLIQLNLDII